MSKLKEILSTPERTEVIKKMVFQMKCFNLCLWDKGVKYVLIFRMSYLLKQ